MAHDDEKDKAPSAQVGRWLKELDACKKREAEFRKQGQDILDIYDACKSEGVPFNILFSNTETLLPAIYSSVPRPVVERRFKDDDPIGKAAAQAGKRVLEFLLDTNVEGYETFDEGMRHATLDGLLPGRGSCAVKYDATMNTAPAADGEEPVEVMESELVCTETTTWNRVWYGYAKKWSQVPWIAYEKDIDKAEASRLFGAEVAEKLVYQDSEGVGGDDKSEKKKEESHRGERKTARIYQIWDKDGGKRVLYVSDGYKDGYLKEEDDPLQLTGFYNCPRPIQFIEKTHTLTPTAPYRLYESQAKELNELTRRIKNICRAIKAKGIYDSELGDDLKKLMDADDNELVPADKSSSLAAEKGLQNAIWFLPIEQLIATLIQLYQAREQCKQVIYEITGISDIVRGSSKASETLGAQEIKTQWGTLRLKRLQREVQRFSRDLLRMMLELAAKKFSEETWAKMTGLPFLVSAKYNELTALMQTMQQQLAMQPPPPPPMPGQAMQGTPPNPLLQQMEQVKAQLQAPQWTQILELLQNDLQRAYRVDIETNSTVEPEAAEDQKAIAELMAALGQYLQSVGPLVINGAMPFQAAQSMLLAITRRFRFGSEVEDSIKAMQPPKPPEDGKAQQQAMEQQKQLAEQSLQMKQQQAEMQIQKKAMQAEMQQKQAEMDLSVREMQLKGEQQIFQMQQQLAEKTVSLHAGHESLKLDQQSQDIDAQQRDVDSQQKDVDAQQSEMEAASKPAGKAKPKAQGAPDLSELRVLMGTMAQNMIQSDQRQEKMLEALAKAITAPKRRRAIRGADGKLESVEEEMVA